MKIAVHSLAAYPPSNLNRDEDGRPKTCMVGGVERLRVSSQCRKRNYRLSEQLRLLDAQHSVRTRTLGTEIVRKLVDGGFEEKAAKEAAESIAKAFGSIDKKHAPQHAENVVYGHEEWAAAMALTDTLLKESRAAPTDEEIASLQQDTVSLDIAMFGRMRAAKPALNVDAAVSVSQLISTHEVAIESDYWTSLDDLAPIRSAGMGETEFAAAVMYGYLVIDIDSLVENLHGDRDLATASALALVDAIAKVGPGAMRSRFAQDTLPSYFRIEAGDPVYNHEAAFTAPVDGDDLIACSIERLKSHASASYTTFGIEARVWELSPEMPLTKALGELSETLSG